MQTEMDDRIGTTIRVGQSRQRGHAQQRQSAAEVKTLPYNDIQCGDQRRGIHAADLFLQLLCIQSAVDEVLCTAIFFFKLLT